MTVSRKHGNYRKRGRNVIIKIDMEQQSLLLHLTAGTQHIYKLLSRRYPYFVHHTALTVLNLSVIKHQLDQFTSDFIPTASPSNIFHSSFVIHIALLMSSLLKILAPFQTKILGSISLGGGRTRT